MSDQARQQQQQQQGATPQGQQPQLSPMLLQWADPKFQAMDYDQQKDERAKLYLSKMKGNPLWDSAPDDQKVRVLHQAREMLPPAFTDPKYDMLRRALEDPDYVKNNPGVAKFNRFAYTTETQMGMTGLVTRGVVNIARAAGDTLANAETRIGRFFGVQEGYKPPSPTDEFVSLMQRAAGGDRDGVKLAKYLQTKYEKPINDKIPLIGGSTPTQLLGSALGYGTDMLAMKGSGEIAEGALTAKTALMAPVVAKLATLGGRAAITGTLGVARGEVAAGINAASSKAPIEGAVDTTHGIGPTVRSVASLWGQWAAQDLAFGMLGQGVTEGLRRVGTTALRAMVGKGSAALPTSGMFEHTAEGAYTPEAEALQRQFLVGNLTSAARSQLGSATADYARSFSETFDYSRLDSEALAKNPVAAWRVSNQHMMEGRNTPLGIATVEDGELTWRLRTGLGRGGEVIGEHQTFSEATMVTHTQWESAISEARSSYAKWNARFEQTHGTEDLRQMQSAQLRLNALQDAFPHDRAIRDSLTIVEGNMNRFAPEGAAKLPSEGAMLTYGEVSQLQGMNLNVAKISTVLAEESMGDISKRGSLINSDAPTRFSTTVSGDYNGQLSIRGPQATKPTSLHSLRLTATLNQVPKLRGKTLPFGSFVTKDSMRSSTTMAM